jgi:hypothetical protein
MFQESRKAQSAMEYLTTHAWSLLIIMIVLGLFLWLGIFGFGVHPRAPPGECQTYRPNGPRTLAGIALVGVCDGELPQFVFVSQGVGDFVLVNSSSAPRSPLNISNNITITAWVDVYGAPYHDVVTKEGEYGMKLNYNNAPHSCAPSDSAGFCLEWDTNNSWIGTSFPIPAGSIHQWMFLSASVQDGKYKSWYANGQLIGNQIVTANQPEATGGCAQYATAVPLAIGGDAGILANTPWGDAGCFPGYGGFGQMKAEWFNGSITNVQIYNSALPPNDIEALYNEGLAGAPIDLMNLAGWWQLNGETNDYSGNNNNGQVYNAFYSGGSYDDNYTIP